MLYRNDIRAGLIWINPSNKINSMKFSKLLDLHHRPKNFQDWRFVIVTDKAKKRQLAEAANNQKFLENAGAIIVACSVSSHIMRCGQPIGPIDIAIALEHICLQAAQSGLATCWIGSFYPEKVRPILGIPEDVAVIELMALGYPADKPPVPNRQPLEKIVCYEKWQFY